MIGEKHLWSSGIGTRVIRLLTSFGFEQQHADAIYGIVADSNVRSRRTFQHIGYDIAAIVLEEHSSKAQYGYALLLTRKRFEQLLAASPLPQCVAADLGTRPG